MAEERWDGGHPSEEMLRDFADGKLDEAGDIEIEEHLMFRCPDLRCCTYLETLPDSISAVLRAIARRHASGRRR